MASDGVAVSRKGRIRFRAWQGLVALAAAAALLIASSRRQAAAESNIAIGPSSAEQAQFFEAAADRPDLLDFYKALSPAGRIAMAKNLALNPARSNVRVAATLLQSYDQNARKALSDALSKLAQIYPDAVVAALGRASSFEREGLFLALRGIGSASIPLICSALANPALRTNAERYLQGFGPFDVAPLVAMLNRDRESRLAAAEMLGKLRAKRSEQSLLALYARATADEKAAVLSALADLGSASVEHDLSKALIDKSATDSTRSMAALGLGRIGSASSIAELLRIAQVGDSTRDIHAIAIAGLILAGDRAIKEATDDRLALEIAAKVSSAVADRAIERALGSKDRAVRLAAADAAKRRPALVLILAGWIGQLDFEHDGDLIEAGCASLVSTEGGVALLERMKTTAGLNGFANRALLQR